MNSSQAQTTSQSLLSSLREHFGYDSFLPLQEKIIVNALVRRDGLAVMPTGSGKSLCYQLPALVLPGMALVVSPLIALMKDQVDSLNQNGVAARFINSSLTLAEIKRTEDEARQGKIKILYAAPERVAMPSFERFLSQANLSLIAVDEAHCISEWGHDFRPEYRDLRSLRQRFSGAPVMALTATATERVRKDIVEQLEMSDGSVFLSSFNRPNLTYSVRPKTDATMSELADLLNQRPGQCAIIYCLSRDDTERMAEGLTERGVPTLAYHAGLEDNVRRRTQEAFINDRAPVIAATIAFGMGIHKPDVRLVVHHSMPKSLESYYQETGRAGRDGLPSDCVLFLGAGDKQRQMYFLSDISDPDERRNAEERLDAMDRFASLPICRRKTLLAYFGESWRQEDCGGCDVCLQSNELFDATEIAQKILSAVIRTGQRFGATYVTDVLVGSKGSKVLERGHDELSVHGVARAEGRHALKHYISHLQAHGFLAVEDAVRPVPKVTSDGWRFLRERWVINLPKPPPPTGKSSHRRQRYGRAYEREGQYETPTYDESLFEELRSLRRKLADEQKVPAFVVFHDSTLREMATAPPSNLREMYAVQGVGRSKLEKYGDDFLSVIAQYAAAKNCAANNQLKGSGPR